MLAREFVLFDNVPFELTHAIPDKFGAKQNTMTFRLQCDYDSLLRHKSWRDVLVLWRITLIGPCKVIEGGSK